MARRRPPRLEANAWTSITASWMSAMMLLSGASPTGFSLDTLASIYWYSLLNRHSGLKNVDRHLIKHLDFQVNNAGVNFNRGSENSVENASEVMETNYFGTKRMIRAFIPLMRPSSHGARILNVSSRLGRIDGRRNVSD